MASAGKHLAGAGFDQTTGTAGGAVGRGRNRKACGRLQGRQIGSARQKEEFDEQSYRD